MAKFYLSNKAVEDLNDIWDYTVKTWSENQAVIYYSLLMDSCQELANKPNQGKFYDVVEKNVLGFKTGEHIIFYQIVSLKEIEVVRILHGMMAIKNHL
ncbi:type II toxin-antitoxin system RelE/ParE family toxin [Flavobacterium paronense]|uniref:Toxin n=1 Tax=Flavobacterium paronense TaxID=1392775 RepID=A0ABV5GA26_9FLAO|nr:type II toxin-antitoxin system RelE/ParE family toxin [Flavobacterium paronense]MDN3677320.1 type II toxin-antitoxin system RelE/ParE family toxin [Flavobacterium paronense]